MLVTSGASLTVGNWLGGTFADKSVNMMLIVTLGLLSALLIAFALLMPFHGPVAVLVLLWGVASFALAPPLQVRVMAAAFDAPNLASSVNIGAFTPLANIGPREKCADQEPCRMPMPFSG